MSKNNLIYRTELKIQQNKHILRNKNHFHEAYVPIKNELFYVGEYHLISTAKDKLYFTIYVSLMQEFQDNISNIKPFMSVIYS